jgi:hypothetical protein
VHRVRAREHDHLARVQAALAKHGVQLLDLVARVGQGVVNVAVFALRVDAANGQVVLAAAELGEAVGRRERDDVGEGKALSSSVLERVLDLHAAR